MSTTILSEDARKKKVQYNQERNKQLRADGIIKDFKSVLYAEEVDKITKTLKELKMNKADFIRWAYKKLLEENE